MCVMASKSLLRTPGVRPKWSVGSTFDVCSCGFLGERSLRTSEAENTGGRGSRGVDKRDGMLAGNQSTEEAEEECGTLRPAE